MQYIETNYIQTATIHAKSTRRQADTDKFNWAYDYIHYIAEDNDDRNLN